MAITSTINGDGTNIKSWRVPPDGRPTEVISMTIHRYDHIYAHPMINYLFCARLSPVPHDAPLDDMTPAAVMYNGTWHCTARQDDQAQMPMIPFPLDHVEQFSWGESASHKRLVLVTPPALPLGR
jgi:hypothetical protein